MEWQRVSGLNFGIFGNADYLPESCFEMIACHRGEQEGLPVFPVGTAFSLPCAILADINMLFGQASVFGAD